MMRWSVLVLALWTPPLEAAQGSRVWRPEERTVISDYTVVLALAADARLVYVATETGLGLYDYRFRRWEPPVSRLEGYPRAPVRTALADPTEEAVWLGTADGLARYRPRIRQWDVFTVPGGVSDLMYDRQDPLRGLFVRTRSGWELLPPGAIIPMTAFDLPPAGRRVRPASVERLLNEIPAADALRADVLLDERLRRFSYTSATRVPASQLVYFGTNGLGLLQFDVGIVRFEQMPFGLVASGAGAVAVAPGGVWVGSDHRAGRPGFSFVDDGLQYYRWEEGPRATFRPFNGVRALVVDGRTVWAATDRGVLRFPVDGGDARQLTVSDGLPDDDSYALAAGRPGIWIGTAFGLALAGGDGIVRRIGRGAPVPVLALAAQGDSVWVGSTAGLGVAWEAIGRVVVPPEIQAVPELRAAIVAVALAGDTVVAATIDRLMWRPPGGAWTVEAGVASPLGNVFALAAGNGGVWVGGERGVGFFRFADRSFRIVAFPEDVPGAVRDLAVSGDWLWAATDGGAVRFLTRALIP